MAQSHEDSDETLARRIRGGDVAAFARLLDRWWQPLVRYADQMLFSQDTAEDVVQEVFIRLWSKRDGLRTTTSPRAYLYRLAHNRAIDELRKRQVRSSRVHLVEADIVSPATPAQRIATDELAEAVARAIRALPARRRAVFILGHYHDLSYREIGETMGISARTVANHMTLALRDLRVALQPFLDR